MRYSIIIPVYKAASNIPNLMECLKAQTDSDFEAIFVDDCSPDDSAAIISAHAAHDKRIRLLRQPRNMRQATARNRGLDEACGEFILFVDADDAFAPNYLERMHEVITKHNADVVLCNPRFDYCDRSIIENMFHKMPEFKELVLNRNSALEYIAWFWGRGKFFYRVEPWGKLIRHSLINHFHLRFQGSYSEDVAFSAALACIAAKTVAINDALYFYNRKNNSDINNNAILYLKHHKEHICYTSEFFKKNLPPDKYRYYFSIFFLCTFSACYRGFKINIKDNSLISQYNMTYKDVFIDITNSFDIDFFDKNLTIISLSEMKEDTEEAGMIYLYHMFIEKYKYKIKKILSI